MACAQSSSEGGFKCGKCRTILIIDSDGEMLLVSPDTIEDYKPKNSKNETNTSLWHLHTDSLPEWITDAIDESSWTKGKLQCPSCQSKVGSFDFVGDQSQSSPVHLVKSKVDAYGQLLEKEDTKYELKSMIPQEISESSVQLLTSNSTKLNSGEDNYSKMAGLPHNELELVSGLPNMSSISSEDSTSDDLSESEIADIDSDSEISNTTSSQITSSYSGSENGNIEPLTDIHDHIPSTSSSSGSSRSNSLDEDRRSIDSNDGSSTLEADVVEIDFVLGSSGDMRLLSRAKKRRLRVNRKNCKHKVKHNRRSRKVEAHQFMEKKMIQEILDAEPELDALDPSLICPVCLDLLHEPFAAIPCKHIFCEPCLRRLASKNPMNTLCPMCRQRIAYCEHKQEMSHSIKLENPKMYAKRMKFERGTPNVYSLPLPWRPGWVNLLSGRAMGGNRFEGESSRDILRRILQQLPYYVPPVVIANLINLVFFIFLLGAVEIVPLLLGLFMGRTPSLGSAPFSKFRNRYGESVVPPHQPGPDSSHEVRNQHSHAHGEGSAVGQDTSTETVDGIRRRSSFVDDIATVSGGMLDVLNGEGGSLDPSSNVLDASSDGIGSTLDASSNLPPNYLPSPEATSPALDATFYYVLCTMILLAAVFGNFLLIHHQPAFGMIQRGTLMERLYNYVGFNRNFQRVSDFLLIIVISCIPILLLPLLMPFPVNGQHAIEDISPLRSFLIATINLIFTSIELVQSFLTMQTILVFGIVYWIGSVYLDYGDD